MRLGLPVIYTAHEGHHTVVHHELPADAPEDAAPKVKHLGSIHHPEHREFAAIVTRANDDGSCDLVIFPPNREPRHVDRVSEASRKTRSHSWRHVEAHHVDEQD